MSVNMSSLHLHVRDGDIEYSEVTDNAECKLLFGNHSVFLHDKQSVGALKDLINELEGEE